MESIDLDMDEIFDSEPGQTNRAEDDVDDDLGRHTGLPDLDFDEDVMRPSQDDNQNEGDEVLSNLKSLAKGAAKKKVTRPQPKLDPQRLKTARGLPVLPKLFKDVKFCGKGHEVEDLKLLMSHLEHWGHRLFPKMPFDDLIERLEKLGGKKEMQTCIKRIRLDMPVLDGDIVAENDGDEEENKKDDDDQHDDEDVAMEDVLNAEEAYEEMIRQEQESRRQLEDDDTSDRADPVDKDHSTGDDAAMEAETAEAEAAEKLKQQRERMEKNRLLALQKRADRLGVPVSTLLSQTNSSSQS